MAEPQRRRGHAALGGRVLAAGLGTAATVGLAALMARADATQDSAPAGPPPAITASPAPAPAPAVIRVVVRPAGTAAAGAPAPTAPAAAPAPARPSSPAPVARTTSS